MTKINKIASFYNVHSHKELKVLEDLIENHIPGRYTQKVINKLAKEGIAVSSDVVRNIKGGFEKDVRVFNAIIEVAKENKAGLDRLKNNLQNAG